MDNKYHWEYSNDVIYADTTVQKTEDYEGEKEQYIIFLTHLKHDFGILI